MNSCSLWFYALRLALIVAAAVIIMHIGACSPKPKYVCGTCLREAQEEIDTGTDQSRPERERVDE